MATENETTAELLARTELWKKLSKLIDIVTPLVEEAVAEAKKNIPRRK